MLPWEGRQGGSVKKFLVQYSLTVLSSVNMEDRAGETSLPF